MSGKEIADHSEVDRRFTALISNANAVQAIAEAVEGTLGPKGLDCMLVDDYGAVKITNDGVTILRTMDVNHPAARLLINAAEYQEETVGDGTTTATIIAGALVSEGADQVMRGVPVTKVIEGIRTGIDRALALLTKAVVRLERLNSRTLREIALIAGRGYPEIADLIMEAANKVGEEQLSDERFKLAEQITALEGAENQLITGTIINKTPLNRAMASTLHRPKIIILDDALDIQQMDQAALATEAGLKHRLDAETRLKEGIQTIAELGVNALFTDRAISGLVEDLLTDLGIVAIERVATKEWQRLAELTGARPIKRGSLARTRAELQSMIGEAEQIIVNERFHQIWVFGKPDQRFVTAIVGGTTPEVVKEKERIAVDAAGAVQAAWRGGVVPGGGSVELAIARRLEQAPVSGMVSYGFECVIHALKRPMTQICINAGFNPLEKIEAVLAHTCDQTTYAYGVNCDTGTVQDLSELGVWDPYFVKYHAIKTAGEVSEAILRIKTIIKMKNDRRDGGVH